MSLDVKIFDDVIKSKEEEVKSAQAVLDADSLQAQLNATKAKAEDLGIKQNQKVDLENKKNRAIELQSIIDDAQTELDEIKQSIGI